MIARITAAYVRRHSDNGQLTRYVEWIDHRGKHGRTEEPTYCPYCGRRNVGTHIRALIARGRREGVALERETW